MKIIKDDAVYVQACDIAFINNANIYMPESIFKIAFGRNMAIIDETNQYEFIKYGKKYINYFKDLDFILDLYETAILSEEEIIDSAKEILLKIKELKERYNSFSIAEQKLNSRMKKEIKLLEYKFDSLGYALQLSKGNILINIPNEVLLNTKPKRRKLLKK